MIYTNVPCLSDHLDFLPNIKSLCKYHPWEITLPDNIRLGSNLFIYSNKTPDCRLIFAITDNFRP